MTDNPRRESAGSETDAPDGSVRAEYEWSSTSPSTAVVETVATAVGRDPTELELLYGSVDPDALDALVHSTGRPAEGNTVTVSFVFAERRVTVRETGAVIVHPVDLG